MDVGFSVYGLGLVALGGGMDSNPQKDGAANGQMENCMEIYVYIHMYIQIDYIYIHIDNLLSSFARSWMV